MPGEARTIPAMRSLTKQEDYGGPLVLQKSGRPALLEELSYPWFKRNISPGRRLTHKQATRPILLTVSNE